MFRKLSTWGNSQSLKREFWESRPNNFNIQAIFLFEKEVKLSPKYHLQAVSMTLFYFLLSGSSIVYWVKWWRLFAGVATVFYLLFLQRIIVVSYQSENFSLKWELPTCSHPHSSTPGRREQSRQVSFWWENTYFNRTPL